MLMLLKSFLSPVGSMVLKLTIVSMTSSKPSSKRDSEKHSTKPSPMKSSNSPERPSKRWLMNLLEEHFATAWSTQRGLLLPPPSSGRNKYPSITEPYSAPEYTLNTHRKIPRLSRVHRHSNFKFVVGDWGKGQEDEDLGLPIQIEMQIPK